MGLMKKKTRLEGETCLWFCLKEEYIGFKPKMVTGVSSITLWCLCHNTQTLMFHLTTVEVDINATSHDHTTKTSYKVHLMQYAMFAHKLTISWRKGWSNQEGMNLTKAFVGLTFWKTCFMLSKYSTRPKAQYNNYHINLELSHSAIK